MDGPIAVGETVPDVGATLVRPDGPDDEVALGVSRRSCFLIDEDLTVRYRWVGDHWLDPTRDTPPVHEIHEAVVEELDVPDAETFGF